MWKGVEENLTSIGCLLFSRRPFYANRPYQCCIYMLVFALRSSQAGVRSEDSLGEEETSRGTQGPTGGSMAGIDPYIIELA